MKPRCAKPVRPYELPGIPVLDDPVCGRPEGHPGVCRSAASVARADEAKRRDSDRINRRDRQKRRTARVHAQLSAAIDAALARTASGAAEALKAAA